MLKNHSTKKPKLFTVFCSMFNWPH